MCTFGIAFWGAWPDGHPNSERPSFELPACRLGQIKLRFSVLSGTCIIERKIQMAVEGEDSLLDLVGFFKELF